MSLLQAAQQAGRRARAHATTTPTAAAPRLQLVQGEGGRGRRRRAGVCTAAAAAAAAAGVAVGLLLLLCGVLHIIVQRDELEEAVWGRDGEKREQEVGKGGVGVRAAADHRARRASSCLAGKHGP